MSSDSARLEAVVHNLLMPAAEMGLLYRPIHLLAGQLPWHECFSPYTRDLTITLEQFALRQKSNEPLMGEKPNHADAQEDWYYKVAKRFLAEMPEREIEKKQMETSMGFLDVGGACPGSLWIDSRRLDWQATDRRISHLSVYAAEPGPVWLILDSTNLASLSGVLKILLQKLNRQVLSCTVTDRLSEDEILNLRAQWAELRLESTDTDKRYAAAAQTIARAVHEPIATPPDPAEPQTTSPPAGPMHRIKA